MNIIEKIKGVIMLGKILSYLDGKKTYMFVVAWGIYKFGSANQWWPENTQLEVILLSGAGLALREGIAKAEKK